jgi:hypothetical protein
MRCSTKDRVTVRSGRSYRVASPPHFAIATARLANETERALEHFALDAGFDPSRPVSVYFKPGIFGHHRLGRALDIYGVAGRGISAWKAQWDDAMRHCRQTGDPVARMAIVTAERTRNLGWRLYRALQQHGRWTQPYGYPIQLFGPWTANEGPWRFISLRMSCAHNDHIHFAL